MKAYDDALREAYGQWVCGCDEVGRGSWSGPLLSAAVILQSGATIEGLNDSKKVAEKKRERLFEEIMEKAASVGISFVGAPEIDLFGITKANIKAMQGACEEAARQLEIKVGHRVDVFVLDQSPKFVLSPQVMLAKADSTSLSVAAASIIAKVTRDRMMQAHGEQWPQYDWANNKGYANDVQIQAVADHGLVDGMHRKTYNVRPPKQAPRRGELRQTGLADFQL